MPTFNPQTGEFETSPDELNQLAVQQGVPAPTTAQGAVSLGADSNQAKMVGTPAQKQSAQNWTLEQVKRYEQPAKAEVSQGAQAKAQQMGQLGQLSSFLGERIAAGVVPQAAPGPGAGSTGQPTQVGALVADQSATASQLNLPAALGWQPDQLTALVPGWESMTLPQISQAIEAERALSLSQVEGLRLRLQDPNLSPSEQEQIRTQLRSLGAAGVTGLEAQAQAGADTFEAAAPTVQAEAQEALTASVVGATPGEPLTEDQQIVANLVATPEGQAAAAELQAQGKTPEEIQGMAKANQLVTDNPAVANLLGITPSETGFLDPAIAAKVQSGIDLSKAIEEFKTQYALDNPGKTIDYSLDSMMADSTWGPSLRSAFDAGELTPQMVTKILSQLEEFKTAAAQVNEFQKLFPANAVWSNTAAGRANADKFVDTLFGTDTSLAAVNEQYQKLLWAADPKAKELAKMDLDNSGQITTAEIGKFLKSNLPYESPLVALSSGKLTKDGMFGALGVDELTQPTLDAKAILGKFAGMPGTDVGSAIERGWTPGSFAAQAGSTDPKLGTYIPAVTVNQMWTLMNTPQFKAAYPEYAQWMKDSGVTKAQFKEQFKEGIEWVERSAKAEIKQNSKSAKFVKKTDKKTKEVEAKRTAPKPASAPAKKTGLDALTDSEKIDYNRLVKRLAEKPVSSRIRSLETQDKKDREVAETELATLKKKMGL